MTALLPIGCTPAGDDVGSAKHSGGLRRDHETRMGRASDAVRAAPRVAIKRDNGRVGLDTATFLALSGFDIYGVDSVKQHG